MRISDIRNQPENSSTVITADIHCDRTGRSSRLWYRVDGIEVANRDIGDALTVGLLPISMTEGEGLSVSAPVSRPLLRKLVWAQKLLARRYESMKPVAVFGESTPAVRRPDPDDTAVYGVGCFFDGMVDSWYSLLKHRAQITHLVVIRGFDPNLNDEGRWRAARAKAAKIADILGFHLLTCETNLRSANDLRLSDASWFAGEDFWTACHQGAAMSSVALLLGQRIREFIVPGSQTYRGIGATGPSPLLDSLWSNDRILITHDGSEAGFLEKIRLIAASTLALKTLRVCNNNRKVENCGRCEPCLRTMVALRIHRALYRARTFPTGLAMGDIEGLIVRPAVRHHYEDMMAAARRVHDDDLVAALEVALGRRFSVPHAWAQGKAWGRQMKGALQRVSGEPAVADLRGAESRATGPRR